jgi:hypothetical protein
MLVARIRKDVSDRACGHGDQRRVWPRRGRLDGAANIGRHITADAGEDDVVNPQSLKWNRDVGPIIGAVVQRCMEWWLATNQVVVRVLLLSPIGRCV